MEAKENTGIVDAPAPQPEHVRRLRAGDLSARDMWESSACGLASWPECLTQLENTSRVRESGPTPPTYVPYESATMPRYSEGERICRQVMDASSSPEVTAAVTASPLGGIMLLAAAAVRQLGASPAGRALDAIAAAAPDKGGEVQRLLPEYIKRHALDPEQAGSMAARNFCSSWFAWCFPRETDGGLVDLCGSVLCLPTVTDHCGVADGSGAGDAAQLAAAEEGVVCLSGKMASELLPGLALSMACMRVERAMNAAANQLSDPGDFLVACGGHVTPAEFTLARWWGACVSAGIPIITTTGHFSRATDGAGAFRATIHCGTLKRAVDSVIRYNAIVDLVSDYRSWEGLNEACLALAVGGGHALLGLGDACARITDDVLVCDCGQPDHEAAAEFSMGNCLYFLLATRYRARQQLADFMAAPNPIPAAYAWPTPGARLAAVAGTALRPGSYSHSPTWQPLWRTNNTASPRQPPLDSPASRLAHRIVSRSINSTAGACEPSPAPLARCVAIAQSVLADCDRFSDRAALGALAGGWCRFFDAVVSLIVTDPTTSQLASNTLRPLIARVWEQVVVGDPEQTTGASDGTDEKLYVDIDHAYRRTYKLSPAEGVALRRAFLGTASGIVELSGLNPLARLANGPAIMMAQDILGS